MSDRVATRPPRGIARRRRARGPFLGLSLALVGPLSDAPGQEARPAAAAGNRLARYVPRQDVFVLLEYEGVDAFPEAWHATVAYKLLTETKLGALLEDLAGQGIEMAIVSAQSAPP